MYNVCVALMSCERLRVFNTLRSTILANGVVTSKKKRQNAVCFALALSAYLDGRKLADETMPFRVSSEASNRIGNWPATKAVPLITRYSQFACDEVSFNEDIDVAYLQVLGDSN